MNNKPTVLTADNDGSIARDLANSNKSKYPNEEVMLEGQRLQNKQIKLMNEKHRVDIENAKVSKLANKIEHARRNLEVIIKLGEAITEKTDAETKKLMDEVAKINLEILKETVNIK